VKERKIERKIYIYNEKNNTNNTKSDYIKKFSVMAASFYFLSWQASQSTKWDVMSSGVGPSMRSRLGCEGKKDREENIHL